MKLRSFRLLRHTLKAIRPIAVMKAATAATDNPAICAGVILGGSSDDFAGGTAVGDVEPVADGRDETESTKIDWVECNCSEEDCVVIEVIVAVDLEDDTADGRGVPLATTVYVRAVLVGMTAPVLLRQMPYAESI